MVKKTLTKQVEHWAQRVAMVGRALQRPQLAVGEAVTQKELFSKITAYYDLTDAQKWDEMLELFDEEAVYVRVDQAIVGMAELKEMYIGTETQPATRTLEGKHNIHMMMGAPLESSETPQNLQQPNVQTIGRFEGQSLAQQNAAVVIDFMDKFYLAADTQKIILRVTHRIESIVKMQKGAYQLRTVEMRCGGSASDTM